MIVEKKENGKENESMWCANSARTMFPEMEGPLSGRLFERIRTSNFTRRYSKHSAD